MATTSTPSAPARLTKEARRLQLLDAAADIISQRGVAAATMERVAEQAGVSKALPYQHFENAADLVSALYWREMTDLATRVTMAVESADTIEERARAGVHAFFDSVGERASVLVALGNVPSLPEVGGAEQRQLSHEFVIGLLRDYFDCTPQDAKASVGILLGALTGAAESWAYGDASRRALEAAAVRVFLACVKG